MVSKNITKSGHLGCQFTFQCLLAVCLQGKQACWGKQFLWVLYYFVLFASFLCEGQPVQTGYDIANIASKNL
jgi:hypothetical protein